MFFFFILAGKKTNFEWNISWGIWTLLRWQHRVLVIHLTQNNRLFISLKLIIGYENLNSKYCHFSGKMPKLRVKHFLRDMDTVVDGNIEYLSSLQQGDHNLLIVCIVEIDDGLKIWTRYSKLENWISKFSNTPNSVTIATCRGSLRSPFQVSTSFRSTTSAAFTPVPVEYDQKQFQG